MYHGCAHKQPFGPGKCTMCAKSIYGIDALFGWLVIDSCKGLALVVRLSVIGLGVELTFTFRFELFFSIVIS